jgi:hypothetical protein
MRENHLFMFRFDIRYKRPLYKALDKLVAVNKGYYIKIASMHLYMIKSTISLISFILFSRIIQGPSPKLAYMNFT